MAPISATENGERPPEVRRRVNVVYEIPLRRESSLVGIPLAAMAAWTAALTSAGKAVAASLMWRTLSPNRGIVQAATLRVPLMCNGTHESAS